MGDTIHPVASPVIKILDMIRDFNINGDVTGIPHHLRDLSPLSEHTPIYYGTGRKKGTRENKDDTKKSIYLYHI